MLDAVELEKMFLREDGTYAFARWGRPISPVVFGVLDETLALVKSAIETVCLGCGHATDEIDPELGSNFMMFFFRDWAELLEVPDLDQMIPELNSVVGRLQMAGSNQYRAFRFDDGGGIQACFVFLRMDKDLEQVGADRLALVQAIKAILLWSSEAFRTMSPLATLDNGTTIMRPDIAALLRAAYDPVMPVATQDPSHALRLSARMVNAL